MSPDPVPNASLEKGIEPRYKAYQEYLESLFQPTPATPMSEAQSYATEILPDR
jgi:hypothetical protein